MDGKDRKMDGKDRKNIENCNCKEKRRKEKKSEDKG